MSAEGGRGGWMDGMNRWMDRLLVDWIDGWMVERMDGCMGGLINGWIGSHDGLNGQMDL